MAKIKAPNQFTIRFNRAEVIALYETVKTLSIPVDNYGVMMSAYRKLEVAAVDARSGE